jgi:hypothetical protein
MSCTRQKIYDIMAVAQGIYHIHHAVTASRDDCQRNNIDSERCISCPHKTQK